MKTKYFNQRLYVMLTKEMLDDLDIISNKEQTTRTDIVRRFLKRGIDNEKRKSSE